MKQMKLAFKGGYLTAYVPIVVFLIFCIYYFVIIKAFEMHALAMGALIGLLIGALFVQKGLADTYWEAVYKGAKDAIPVVMLLLVIGMFSEMIKASNLSGGFVYLATQMNISGGLYTAMTFLFVSLIATATGSSIGSLFTCFPIFYPAGVLLGSQPAVLAGAIVSGAVFGDNLAPISDTTIISAGTQYYKHHKRTADVGGAVRTRLKYSLISGAVAFVLFMLVGGGYQPGEGAAEMLVQFSDPRALLMLLPVALMLIVSVRTGDMYLAITLGLVAGSGIGLLSGVLIPADILSVVDGSPSGFLVDGVGGMMNTCILVLSVYGIMGVLEASGALDKLTDGIYQSKLCDTVAGTEVAMMLGIILTSIIFGGVTSASMTTFGKVQNELGQRAGLHPYRRANLLDGFANSLGVAVPFLSVFIFLGSQLTQGYDFVSAVSVVGVSKYIFHCYGLFAVFFASTLTGWGRKFEGPKGEALTQQEYEAYMGDVKAREQLEVVK